MLLKPIQRHPTDSEEGLTLIECLMGILILTSILVGIAPPLGIVVATRVQNRRAEQAQQLAQGEVDRIRVIVEQGSYAERDLPELGDSAPSTLGPRRSPNPDCNDANQRTTLTQLLQVDLDGNCNTDFLVQTFRTQENRIDQETLGSFTMGVRVYSAVAQNNLGGLQTQRASLKLAGGEGSQRSNPLAVISTRIVRSDREYSLCLYNPSLCGINPPANP